MRYCLSRKLLPFMVALSFYGTFSIWEKICKKACKKAFAIISFALLLSRRFDPHNYFRLFCKTTIIEMPSLIRKEKITCEKCGIQTTRTKIVRQKKRCSVGTLYCTRCSNSSTKSKSDLKHHIAKKHSAPKLDVTFKCKLYYQEFPQFYALRQHRNSQHEKEMGSGTRDMDQRC